VAGKRARRTGVGGALANPMDGAVLLFKGGSPEVAENFAKADPYVTSGIVKRWYVRNGRRLRRRCFDTCQAYQKLSSQSAMSERKGPDPAHVAGPCKRRERGRVYSARNQKGLSVAPSNRAASRRIPAPASGWRVIELVVLSLWESMEAIRKFAGAEPAKAVVEPEARATLRTATTS